MPGFRSDSLKISTLPDLGRAGAGSEGCATADESNATASSAASLYMGPSLNGCACLHYTVGCGLWGVGCGKGVAWGGSVTRGGGNLAVFGRRGEVAYCEGVARPITTWVAHEGEVCAN